MTPQNEQLQGQTRDLITQAAAKAFSERGYSDAVMKEIAKEAGVHETTLFRHFENKEALLRAVIEWASEDMAEMLGDFANGWTDNPERDLKLFARAYQKVLLRHDGIIRLLLAESGHRAEELKQLGSKASKAFLEHLVVYLEQAKLMGQIRSDLNPEKVAGVLTGMVTIDVLRYGKSVIPAFSEDNLDIYFDIFMRGILVRKS